MIEFEDVEIECSKSPNGKHVPNRLGGGSHTLMSRNNRYTLSVRCEWCGAYGTEVYWMQDAPKDPSKGPYQVIDEVPGPSTFNWNK